jgi:hypothetical protein
MILSDVRVIIAIMRVLVEESLSQAHVSLCGYVLSCHALNTTAS